MQGLLYLNSLTEWNGKADFSIDKLRPILTKLGDPDRKFIPIHVAGTNGKGSVSTFIAAILAQSTDQGVGLYTSPHLERVNERIVLNGWAVSDQLLNSAVERVLAVGESLAVKMSYFEILTVVAFLIFAEQGLKYGVIEVGLGGRLDATNILAEPKISVITSIAYDHMAVLGSTLPEIAREKGGIIRRGVPVVVGCQLDPAALQAISTIAEERSAPLYMAQLSDIVDKYSERLDLKGDHQLTNAAVAAKVAELLGVGEQEVGRGLGRAWWPGRIELAGSAQGGEILLDAAHNPHGAAALANWLSANRLPRSAVFGVVADKDWRQMIELVLPFCERDWLLLKPKSVRALEPAVVADHLSCLGVSSDRIVLMDENYQGACDRINNTRSGAGVLVWGSMYMMGQIRLMLGVPWRSLW
jgi:dihydrofolate synthase/folylpolyglutamate synthase